MKMDRGEFTFSFVNLEVTQTYSQPKAGGFRPLAGWLELSSVYRCVNTRCSFTSCLPLQLLANYSRIVELNSVLIPDE